MSRDGENFAGRPVVWLNGAFGVGKTSAAADPARQRPTTDDIDANAYEAVEALPA